MSAGSRSGVNCTRLKSQRSVAANALASVVLATPGTPSSSTWPRANRQTSKSSATSGAPTNTRLTSRVTSVERAAMAARRSGLRASLVSFMGTLRRCIELREDTPSHRHQLGETPSRHVGFGPERTVLQVIDLVEQLGRFANPIVAHALC